MKEKENLLIIFTRNPVLGKVKTRLAKDIGERAALQVYKFLLEHTFSATKNLNTEKQVHYSEAIPKNDIWDEDIFQKRLQKGRDLGKRMNFAFKQAFSTGYKKVVLIGSDNIDLKQQDIEDAFFFLDQNDFVIGPASDGGYYLLGMNSLNSNVFKNKSWSTSKVLKETLNDLKKYKVQLLQTRNDADEYEDIKHHPQFRKFLSNKE